MIEAGGTGEEFDPWKGLPSEIRAEAKATEHELARRIREGYRRLVEPKSGQDRFNAGGDLNGGGTSWKSGIQSESSESGCPSTTFGRLRTSKRTLSADRRSWAATSEAVGARCIAEAGGRFRSDSPSQCTKTDRPSICRPIPSSTEHSADGNGPFTSRDLRICLTSRSMGSSRAPTQPPICQGPSSATRARSRTMRRSSGLLKVSAQHVAPGLGLSAIRWRAAFGDIGPRCSGRLLEERNFVLPCRNSQFCDLGSGSLRQSKRH